MKQIEAEAEAGALKKGFALRENRVAALDELTMTLLADLKGNLWLTRAKALGSGEMTTIVDYEEFNRAEIETVRGVLDDLAKETGGRGYKLSSPTEGEDGLTDEDLAEMSDEELEALVARTAKRA